MKNTLTLCVVLCLGAVRVTDDVDRTFARKAAAIDRTYQDQMNAARAERIQALKSLLNRAMDRKDADAVVELREKIKVGESDINSASQLDFALRGSAWTWGTEPIRFMPDGTIMQRDWVSRGLVTQWKVIDRRTVVCFIAKGRTENRYAVLTFTEKIDSYSGYDFEGGLLAENHPVSR